MSQKQHLEKVCMYFYAKGTCPIAHDIASRVLTLPTYYGLPLEDVKDIAKNVLEIVK